ncbi:MAG: hypothetical protein ACK2UK_10160 [Candidatus Promineifilaceae bacterium]
MLHVRSSGRSIFTPHGFSPSVVPRPTDGPARATIPGYWFLEEAAGYKPPDDLRHFLQDGTPPVYIGFGSMADKDPECLARRPARAYIPLYGRSAVLGKVCL